MGDNPEFKELNSRALVGTVDWDSGGTETSSDILGPAYTGSANAGGQGIVGGSAGGRNEFILEPDEWYRIRVISRAANNAVTIYLDWYDHAEQTDLTG